MKRQIHVYIYIYTYMHMHTYTYVYIYIYTHIYACRHSAQQPLLPEAGVRRVRRGLQ